MWSDWATFDTDNGYTLATDCTWIKIGRIMIAQLIVKSNNGFTQPYGQNIATIKTKYRNMNIINTTCVLANNNWNVQPQSKLGSVYINNSGVMSINNQTPSDTTNIYAKFTLVYALKNA